MSHFSLPILKGEQMILRLLVALRVPEFQQQTAR